MDLIYTNEKKEDIGVLMDYTFDLAFGKDENDFECEVPSSSHVCREGYRLHIEGTEYGGVIDKIRVNTASETITYSGRTWHGILAGKVLEPDEGEDYLLLSGDANEVLAFLIDRTGLSDTFTVSRAVSGIEIVDYPVRYQDAYTAIRKMLFTATGKLRVQYKRDIVELSAIPYEDYSQNEEWDSSQMDFEIQRDYRPVNHLICLGTGDLKERHVIHLFTDENGGVQPYSTTERPVEDSDYILDRSMQQMFGEDEVTDIYDYPSASAAENYVLLMEMPENWGKTYAEYYQQGSDDKYTALESWEEDVYTLQKIRPYDWDVNYTDYFRKSGNGYDPVGNHSETIYTLQTAQPSDWKGKYGNYYKKSGSNYKEVDAAETKSYAKQKKKPSDWSKNYGNYYYYYSDGTAFEYRSVSGITKYRYTAQTMKPSDWEDNFQSYFKKKEKGSGYVAVEGNGEKKDKAPKWKAKRYYTKSSYNVAPKWEKDRYYTLKKTVAAPAWAENTYYTKSVQNVPTWAENTYYTKSTEIFIPTWTTGAYYRKAVDNFSELVAGGLERLAESYDCDTVNISFEPDQSYDIGDVVGAIENITGISIWQPITKKIVTIKDNKEEIQYEIGE